MPDGNELEEMLERAEDHLDAYEISRLMQMEDARKHDPWEVEHEHEGGAPGMG